MGSSPVQTLPVWGPGPSCCAAARMLMEGILAYCSLTLPEALLAELPELHPDIVGLHEDTWQCEHSHVQCLSEVLDVDGAILANCVCRRGEMPLPRVPGSQEPGQSWELQAAPPSWVRVTVKLCMILIDQLGLLLEEVAGKEVREECGYHLALPAVTCKSGVGLTYSGQSMFHAEGTNTQHGRLDGDLAEEGKLSKVMPSEDDPSVPNTLSIIFSISLLLSHMTPSPQINTPKVA